MNLYTVKLEIDDPDNHFDYIHAEDYELTYSNKQDANDQLDRMMSKLRAGQNYFNYNRTYNTLKFYWSARDRDEDESPMAFLQGTVVSSQL